MTEKTAERDEALKGNDKTIPVLQTAIRVMVFVLLMVLKKDSG